MEDALAPGTSGELPDRAKPGALNREGLEALLAAFHSNRSEAAERYAALRDRLSRFFEWNRASDPDALADEVLDRLARRVTSSAGDSEAVRHPEKFATGVARLLLHEQWRDQKANERMTSVLGMQHATNERRLEEQRQTELAATFLDECLSRLTERHRHLIQRYYSTESRTQMDTRKKLAEEFNISLNALRNRALRIREELERCVRSKLDRHTS